MENKTSDELLQYFEKVKNKAITKYNLEGLTEAEIGEALFKLYTLERENVKDNLEKIIILDYSENFLDEIASPLLSMLNQIKPDTEFQDNQNLFSIRNKLAKTNKTLTQITLDKYNCFCEEDILIDQITKEEKPINSQLLKEILSKQEDLFALPKPKYPEVRARHELRESNYNPDYWTAYVQNINTKTHNIISYFEETEKLAAAEEFMNIASLYYNYMTNYNRINEIDTEKRKTI